MKIDTAIQAGQIAAEIQLCENAIAIIEQAQAGNWTVSALSAISPAGTQQLLISPLDQPTSQQAFSFALQVYQGMLAALQGQLAAL